LDVKKETPITLVTDEYPTPVEMQRLKRRARKRHVISREDRIAIEVVSRNPVKILKERRRVRRSALGSFHKVMLDENHRTPLTVAFRHIKPSWRNYIDYARLAAQEGDDDMIAFIKTFEALTRKEQRTLPPEQICELAHVKPSELFGAIAEQLWGTGLGESQILAAIEHPQVMGAVAKRAKRKDGRGDSELFLRATGSLPDRKGASIIVNNTPVALAASKTAAVEGDGFRSVSSKITQLDRLLGKPALVTVDAEEIEE
jgi:hypothetical protein